MSTKSKTKLYGRRTKEHPYSKAVPYAAYIFIISLYLVSSPPKIMLLTLLFSALHEAAHIICAKALGREVSPWRFSFFGLCPDTSSGSALSTLFIYASGPAVNLAVSLVSIAVMRGGGSDTLLYVFSINALLFVYNIIPVPFSDGDGIMRTVLSFFLSSTLVKYICAVLNVIFSTAVFSLFSYRFLFLGSGLFSFFCSFIFLFSSFERLLKG